MGPTLSRPTWVLCFYFLFYFIMKESYHRRHITIAASREVGAFICQDDAKINDNEWNLGFLREERGR